MELRILGPFEVERDGRAVSLPAGRRRALLVFLALNVDEVVSGDRIVAELWPAGAPPTAPKIVQTYVSDLRKALGDGVLETRAPGYVLRLPPDALDATRFERLVATSSRALAGGDPAAAAGGFRDALALWRGPALADFAYDDFAQAEIARLEELRLAALEQRLDADLALGRELEVLPELDALVQANPLRERPRGLLMLALYRAGRQSEALHVFQDARRTLGEELGIEPGPSLRELEQAILVHDPALGSPRRAAAGRGQEEGGGLATLVSVALEDAAGPDVDGDEAARRLLDVRDRVVPAELGRAGGRALERVSGDVVAAFGSARDAVRFATTVRSLASAQTVEARIGMVLGETASGEPLGATLGAGRLAATAAAGQILLTQAVKNLAGAVDGIEFRRAGRVRLRGYADPWEVFEAVPAGEAAPPESLGARLRRRLGRAGR